MKKQFIFLLVLLNVNIYAQVLVPFQHENKWGFCDTSLKVVLPPIYDVAAPFEKGIAIVGISKKFTASFSEQNYPYDLIKYGLIDTKGREILPFKYDNIKILNDRIELNVYKLIWGEPNDVYDENGKHKNRVYQTQIDSTAFASHSGKIMYTFNSGKVKYLGNGIYCRVFEDKTTGKSSSELCLQNKKIIIFNNTEIFPFSSERAVCHDTDKTNWFIIDTLGNIVFETKAYLHLGHLVNNELLASTDTTFVLLDNNFKTLQVIAKRINDEKAFISLFSILKRHRQSILDFETDAFPIYYYGNLDKYGLSMSADNCCGWVTSITPEMWDEDGNPIYDTISYNGYLSDMNSNVRTRKFSRGIMPFSEGYARVYENGFGGKLVSAKNPNGESGMYIINASYSPVLENYFNKFHNGLLLQQEFTGTDDTNISFRVYFIDTYGKKYIVK